MSDRRPSPLLLPYEGEHLRLPNRIAMAPMTRGRADDVTGVPSPLTATYYAQRAGAGLIVSEGIWSDGWARPAPASPAWSPRSRWRAGARSPRPCTRRAGGSSPSCGMSAA